MGLDHECSHSWCFTFSTVFGVNVTGQVTVTVIVYRVPDLLSCAVYPSQDRVPASVSLDCPLIIIGARRMSTRDTISVMGLGARSRVFVFACSLRLLSLPHSGDALTSR